MFKTSKTWEAYWAKRKIDWKVEYLATKGHPHRRLFIDFLKDIPFRTAVELGCASGPNLLLIHEAFPQVVLGGVDVSKDAIKVAKEVLPQGTALDVSSADKIYFPPKSADVVLTDMCLIYLSKKRFRNALKEVKRIGRKKAIFCEFHSRNPLRRLALRLAAGYNAHDFEKELARLDFYDIQLHKLTEAEWPGGEPQKEFGYFITASI